MFVYSFIIIIFGFSVAYLLKFFNPIDVLFGFIYLDVNPCKRIQIIFPIHRRILKVYLLKKVLL